MRKILYLAGLFLLVIVFDNALADTLYLKNGTQFTGRVIKYDSERVTFQIGEGQDAVEATFFNEEVLRMDKAEVSSFISVPFGQGKQLEFPRPIFENKPLLNEQAKVQKERQADSEKEYPGTNTTAKEKGSLVDQAKQADSQGNNLPNKEVPMGINVTDSPSLSGNSITEQLSLLLNQDEKDYFVHINSLLGDVTSTLANMLGNPEALTQGTGAIADLIKSMPSKIDGIIKNLDKTKIPELFVEFHKKYLGNLSLIKGIFDGMSSGSLLNSQPKLQELQSAQAQLQEELGKILEIKKKK
jgi:hypothetical protein